MPNVLALCNAHSSTRTFPGRRSKYRRRSNTPSFDATSSSIHIGETVVCVKIIFPGCRLGAPSQPETIAFFSPGFSQSNEGHAVVMFHTVEFRRPSMPTHFYGGCLIPYHTYSTRIFGTGSLLVTLIYSRSCASTPKMGVSRSFVVDNTLVTPLQ